MTKKELYLVIALAIQKHEGYFQPLWGTEPNTPKSIWYPRGTIAWKYKNPGNLVYHGQVGSLGRGLVHNFAIFKSYEDGLAALAVDVEAKFSGHTSTNIRPTSSLLHYFEVYAPWSDGNNPIRYAKDVALQISNKLGKPISIYDTLETLLNQTNG